jgi:ribosomal protein L37AE/L43A
MNNATLRRYMQVVTPFLTNRRFCTTCMNERPADQFVRLERNHTAIWRCKACVEKTSESWVSRKKSRP